MKLNYEHTRRCCYLAAVTCAIVNFYISLLFVTFRDTFGVTLEQLGFLATVNFVIQIFVDYLGAKLADRIGYRAVMIMSQLFQGVGFILLATLPYMMSAKYAALIISTIIYGIGSGLNEIVRNPIIEALPGDNKASKMSLLHSFYCWGCVIIIVFSALFFGLVGIDNWRYLTIGWSLVSFVCAVLFIKAPIAPLIAESKKSLSVKELITDKLFLVMLVLMLCSGAEEMALSQWVSMFVEKGLGISKTLGDLVGPCLFAIAMGVERTIFGKIGHKLDLLKSIIICSVLCIISYCLTTLFESPIIAIIGCILCGFSVGIMWPGVTSLATKYIPEGGTLLFGFISLFGDLGCAVGPALVGVVAGKVINASEYDALRTGIFSGIIFPVLMLVFSLILLKMLKKHKQNN